jgi:predicted enzyme related to lactoylglutathione lyase
MSDPLDALRAPIVPTSPDPLFAARLQRRLELMITGQGDEQDMTEVLRDRLSRHGSRHGDVSYITLALPDADRGRRFYGAALGWTFAAGRLGSEENQADRVIPGVGLWTRSTWREGVTAGAILSWRVDDIAAAVEAVRASGGTATDPDRLPYGLQSECTDGQGLRFWLHELPPPGDPAPGNGASEGDISYLVLRVADLARGQHFFSSVLGWTFTPGNAGVQVEGPVPMTGMSQGSPGVELCYRMDDVAAAVERVRGAGGEADTIESRPYGLEARCRDDQGLQFYLHQLA